MMRLNGWIEDITEDIPEDFGVKVDRKLFGVERVKKRSIQYDFRQDQIYLAKFSLDSRLFLQFFLLLESSKCILVFN